MKRWVANELSIFPNQITDSLKYFANKQQNLTDKYDDEDILLHYMTASELVAFVSNNALSQRISDIKKHYPNKKITLLVFGMKDLARAKKQSVNRHAVEMALTELQLLDGISHRHLDTSEDVAQVFLQFSKSIGEKLYKYEHLATHFSARGMTYCHETRWTCEQIFL